MIKVILELENQTAFSMSPLEGLIKDILTEKAIRIDENTLVVPYSWDYNKNKWIIKIKKVEQI